MKITCPHCAFKIRAKSARPGRFKATCLNCGGKFRITVREAASGEKFGQPSQPALSGNDPQATGAWAALPLGSDGEVPSLSTPRDPSKTLVWGVEVPEESLAPFDVDDESISTSAWSVEALGSTEATALNIIHRN